MSNAAVAAIEFSRTLGQFDGWTFLDMWFEGLFPEIREEWPDAPESIFIGADPLHSETTPAPAPEQQVEQEPVTCLVGMRGSAYDTPDVKRAYTYTEQPGNGAAWRLGEAAHSTTKDRHGDYIDSGLSLLKYLAERGFGVFDLGAEYAAPAPEQQVEQEPVGYRITDGEGGYEYRDNLPDAGSIAWSARYGRIWEPLYAAPPAAPDVSGLVEALEQAVRHAKNAKTCFDRDYPEDWSGELHLVALIRDADAALSAYREQQGEKP